MEGESCPARKGKKMVTPFTSELSFSVKNSLGHAVAAFLNDGELDRDIEEVVAKSEQ